MELAPLPDDFAATRDSLHRVGVHVLARRRFALTGKFGLRVTPGGFGSPAAGAEHETVRVSGAFLFRERTGAAAATTVLDLRAATLADAAAAVEVDLAEPFAVGRDTPDIGDPAGPLKIDSRAATALGAWYSFGAPVLDAAVAAVAPGTHASVVQLWPEHFDVGVDIAERCTIGASPGDEQFADPYVYVSVWTDDRPGDPAYWNAPFGAVIGYRDLAASGDAHAAAAEFLRVGLDRLSIG